MLQLMASLVTYPDFKIPIIHLIKFNEMKWNLKKYIYIYIYIYIYTYIYTYIRNINNVYDILKQCFVFLTYRNKNINLYIRLPFGYAYRLYWG